MNDLYLKHHGILGQKWGVRRYQNLDGSLTEEGKARRQKYIDKQIKENNKYYEGYKKKYQKKADESTGRTKKKYLDMYKSAEESRQRVNEYLRSMSYDQVVANQKADRDAKLKAIGLGTALATSAAATAGIAAVAPGTIATGIAFAKSLDYVALGNMAADTVEKGIRMYARARGWAIGIALDEGLNTALSKVDIDPNNAERLGKALGEASKVAGNAALEEALKVDYATVAKGSATAKSVAKGVDAAASAYDTYRRYK